MANDNKIFDYMKRTKNNKYRPSLIGQFLEACAQNQSLTDQVTRLKEQLDEATQNSLTDSLTGLPNLRALRAYLQSAIPNANRYNDNKKLCISFIDIDGLKQVNDCYGHEAGNTLLRKYADTIKHEMRAGDTVYRVGGDEIIVVAAGVPEKIENKIHTISKSLEAETIRVELIPGEWKNIQLWGFSYGVHVVDSKKSFEDNYDAADKLMYKNKQIRKDTNSELRYTLTTEMLDDRTKRENYAKQSSPPEPV